jgi:hypothetical protein
MIHTGLIRQNSRKKNGGIFFKIVDFQLIVINKKRNLYINFPANFNNLLSL